MLNDTRLANASNSHSNRHRINQNDLYDSKCVSNKKRNSEAVIAFKRYRCFGYRVDISAALDVRSITSVSRHIYEIVTSTITLQYKACHKCKRLLDSTHFYYQKSPCKDCRKFLVRQWQQRNPEKVKTIKSKSNKRYRYKMKLRSVGLE